MFCFICLLCCCLFLCLICICICAIVVLFVYLYVYCFCYLCYSCVFVFVLFVVFLLCCFLYLFVVVISGRQDQRSKPPPSEFLRFQHDSLCATSLARTHARTNRNDVPVGLSAKGFPPNLRYIGTGGGGGLPGDASGPTGKAAILVDCWVFVVSCWLLVVDCC